METKNIDSNKAPKPVGLYSHAKQVGNLLFLAGMGPRKRDSKEIPGVTLDEKGVLIGYDIEPQCHSVFENIKQVLEDAGSSWDKIVDVTVFLIDIKRDFNKFNEIYADYFKDIKPTRTTVEVSRLPTPIAIVYSPSATV